MKCKKSTLEFVLFLISIVLIFVFNSVFGVAFAIISLILSIKRVKSKNILTMISLIGSTLLIIFSIISFIIAFVFVNNLFNAVKNISNTQSSNEIVDSMREHLNRRYDYFTYQIDSFIASGWDHSYDLLNLSTMVDGVEKDFVVKRYKTGNGYKYCDSYLSILIENDLEEFVKIYSDKYFYDNLVFVNLEDNCIFEEFDNNSTLSEYLNYKNLDNIIIFIMVKESFDSIEEFNSHAKQLVLDLIEKSDKLSPRVIYLSEENYDTLNEENYTDYFVDNKLAEYNKSSLYKENDD